MTRVAAHRPARTWPPPLPTGELTVAAPPRLPATSSGRLAWLQYLLPVAGSVGSLVFVLANPRPLFLIGGALFAATGLASGIGMYLQQRASTRGRLAAERRRYAGYLDELRPELERTGAAQRRDACWRHPDPGVLWDLVRRPERIWERRPADSDFLAARIGLADQPLATRIVLFADEPLTERDPVSQQAAAELLATYGELGALPFAIELTAGSVISVVGDRGAGRGMVRGLLCQVAALHSPADVAVAVCAPLGTPWPPGTGRSGCRTARPRTTRTPPATGG